MEGSTRDGLRVAHPVDEGASAWRACEMQKAKAARVHGIPIEKRDTNIDLCRGGYGANIRMNALPRQTEETASRHMHSSGRNTALPPHDINGSLQPELRYVDCLSVRVCLSWRMPPTRHARVGVRSCRTRRRCVQPASVAKAVTEQGLRFAARQGGAQRRGYLVRA